MLVPRPKGPISEDCWKCFWNFVEISQYYYSIKFTAWKHWQSLKFLTSWKVGNKDITAYCFHWHCGFVPRVAHQWMCMNGNSPSQFAAKLLPQYCTGPTNLASRSFTYIPFYSHTHQQLSNNSTDDKSLKSRQHKSITSTIKWPAEMHVWMNKWHYSVP